MDELVSLQGPVERIDGQLTLRIPRDVGGDALYQVATKISSLDEECLNVVIPDWLAAKLGIVDGSIVAVDNRNHKFNITLVPVDEPAD